MSLKDLVHIVLFNLSSILRISVLTSLILLIILVFIYPVTYKSEVTILPPEQNNFGNLSSIMAGNDFSNILKAGSGYINSQLFIEMLKSRSASLYVVEKHNLKNFFNVDNNYEAAEKLNKNLNIELNKEGIIKLSVEVTSSLFPVFTEDSRLLKELSARLSNSYIEALDKINREKKSSKAKNARIYIEGQIQITKATLDSAENALMKFQQKNKTVALPEQLKAAIDAAAELKSEILKTEFELGLLKYNLREDTKTYIALTKKLKLLNDQYKNLDTGNEDYILAFKNVPELGKELANIVREIKIHNEVYTLLQQQYYLEKIQENRDTPTVEILDEAIIPRSPSSPRIIYSSMIGFVFFFLSASSIYLFKERRFYQRKKDEI